MWQDIRFGLRTLVRAPGFTAVAAVTLALGIGASTAIFSVVTAVLLRHLPFNASEQLVTIRPATRQAARFRIQTITPGDFLDWQSRNRSFGDMSAFTGATFALTSGGEPQRVLGASVSPRFFETIGVRPIMGRTFGSIATTDDANGVIVIGGDLWRGRFQADPGI